MAMTTSTTTVHNDTSMILQRQRRPRDHRKASFSSLTTMTKEEAGRKAAQLATSVAGAVDDRQRRRLLQLDDYDDNSKDNATRIAMATMLSHAGITTTSSCDGGGEERRENHPMSPPLHTATTYTRPPDGIYKDSDSIYSRMDNPTRLLLEKNIFDLECTNLLDRRYRNKKEEDDDDTKKRNDDDDNNGTHSIPLLPLPLCTTTTTCYSSGMQAVTSILLAHSSSPTNMTVLIPTDVYHGVRSLLSGVFSRHGINVQEINMSSASGGGNNAEDSGGEIAIATAISRIAIAATTTAPLASSPTTTTINNNSDIDSNDNGDHNHNHDLHNIIVWMETPSNPKCEVVDIKTICDKVRSVGERWKNAIKITTVVDGTMSSPVLTRPLEVC